MKTFISCLMVAMAASKYIRVDKHNVLLSKIYNFNVEGVTDPNITRTPYDIKGLTKRQLAIEPLAKYTTKDRSIPKIAIIGDSVAEGYNDIINGVAWPI